MADTLSAPANLIAGEWRASAGGDTYEKRNPAHPDEVVGEFPSSTREDVDLAVQAADDARGEWARGPIARRAAVLTAAAALIEERAEAIAQDMTREMGKPLREAAWRRRAPPRSCATRRARRSAPSASSSSRR